MADGRKGNLARLGILIIVLAAAGGYFMYKRSLPPKGGNLERIVLEDSAGLRGKTLEDVKRVFRHDKPDPGSEEGVWVFDFSKVDPSNPAKIEVVIRRGQVASMREFDGRIPEPKPALTGDPEPSDAPAEPPADAPAEPPTDGTSTGGG
ncbi:MAG: hypothetical protein GIKADHBN_00041 [Phycisphaerales bacterium]|nr:hypothetical protein [Phycisphaerales bacterium]